MSTTLPVQNTPQPRTWHFWMLSLLSGFLLMLSWPNTWVASFAAWPSAMAWVALIPYSYVWRRVGWRGALVHAWVMGFTYYFGILSWITLVNRDTNVDNTITWMILTVCGAFYMALFGATSKMVADRFKWPGALVVPLGWTAWEYLRGHVIFGGWPWGSLGHTQYSNPWVRQMAAVVGVGGLSYLVAAANFFLAWAGERVWARLRGVQAAPAAVGQSGWVARAKARPILYGLSLGLVLAWAVFAVWAGVESAAFYRAPKKEMRIAMLQGNTDTTQKWNRAYKTALMERMARLHASAISQKPELVIWAESCFPGMLGNDDQREWEDRLKQMIKSGGVPTLLTSNEYVSEPGSDGERYHHYNSAFLLGGDGAILGRYRKIHLVPFGEYIPWDILKNFLHSIVREPIPVDFEPGHEYASIEYGALKFSPLICYEDGFEELGFKLARRGARFFAGLANDRWAGTSAMSYQHTATSVFLAIEHRVYMAKANMTGPTCLVDPWGGISQPLPYFQEGVKLETISYVPGFKPFFSRFGNVVPFGLTLLFFGILAITWIFPKKPPEIG